MPVLAKIPLPAIFHFAAVETAGTLFLCYGIAVVYKHVPAWLPMISDCAVEAPERYPFRLGIVVAAVLIALQVLLVYKAGRYFSGRVSSLLLGVAASCCLGVVAVVNEVENGSLHSGAAVLFFLLYWMNMIVLNDATPSVVGHPPQSSPLVSRVLRTLCTTVTGAALIAVIYMSPNWSKNHLYIAICEWVATFSIVLFNWTFSLDCTRLTLAEVAADTDNGEQTI